MKLNPALESRRVRTQPWRRTSRPIDSAFRAIATVILSMIPPPRRSARHGYNGANLASRGGSVQTPAARHNLERKCRQAGLDTARAALVSLSARREGVQQQTDT